MAHICDYFPCHEWKNGYSCKYCHCPLFEKDCEKLGGKPSFINDELELIKDCSNCTLPHQPEFENLLTEIKKDVIIKE